ncbi:hypothetical protein EUX98_g8144 [Antrodiella citrinella]|uniref:Uncharacterized protein n=1 Tax=Antrodiella citrinella TaxID=2447956 RepID=A0A4S4MDQ4_9APHY|nr:hypothetical protein EUX98_g8144 [Antrodiella citrinella]
MINTQGQATQRGPPPPIPPKPGQYGYSAESSTPRIPAHLKGKAREGEGTDVGGAGGARGGNSYPVSNPNPNPVSSPNPVSNPNLVSEGNEQSLVMLLFHKMNSLHQMGQAHLEESRETRKLLAQIVQMGVQQPFNRQNDTVQRRRRGAVNGPEMGPIDVFSSPAPAPAPAPGPTRDGFVDHAVASQNHPGLSRLKDAVRQHFVTLSKCKTGKQLLRKHPPLKKEQITAISENAPNAIVVTADHFRVDFEESWKKGLLNQNARTIFVENFLLAVQGGMYSYPPITPDLLFADQIGDTLDRHMNTLRRRYRDAKKPKSSTQDAKNAILSRMRSRRGTLYESRVTCCIRRGLASHVRLLSLLSPAHMSGDETDSVSDGEHHRPRRVAAQKEHAALYRIVDVPWRSAEFTTFLRTTDAMYRDDWADKLGRAGIVRVQQTFLQKKGLQRRAVRTGGNPPRTRVEKPLAKDATVKYTVPSCLPRNCYKIDWLRKLQPWRRTQMGILEQDYDFTFPADSSTAMESEDPLANLMDIEPEEVDGDEDDREEFYLGGDEEEDSGDEE